MTYTESVTSYDAARVRESNRRPIQRDDLKTLWHSCLFERTKFVQGTIV
jgi:hypothetical protein